MLRQVETTTATNATVARESASITERQPAVKEAVSGAAPFTAEEIADAIAELEKERLLQQSAQNEAAQISDVLEQLHLDLPPAAVAAKIEQGRATRSHAKQVRRRRRTLWTILGSSGIAACLAITGFVWKQNHPVVVPLSQILVTQEAGTPRTTSTLAEAPENMLVSLSADQLKRVVNARGADSKSFPTDVHWEVTRKGGVGYLLGYTQAPPSRNALRSGETISLQSSPSGFHDGFGCIEVPLDSIQVVSAEHDPNLENHQKLQVRIKDADKVLYP